MCGIAGILDTGRNVTELQERVIRMREGLSHRGPDDVGLYAADGIALAHTRLSIIDLAGGHQPIRNEDGTIHFVVNGGIYNYKALQKKLSSRRHHLRTQSDSKVIVHLYEDEGVRCVEHLDGMFAFALWDARNKKLLLARDRMSMAHGLEVRVPLLDYRLVEFALSLPPSWLVSALPVEGKRIMRKVADPLLSDGILNRPKQGFVIPLNEWLKDYFLSIFDTLCLGAGSYLTGLLGQKAIFKLRQQRLGNGPRHDLYALLILELWLRQIRNIERNN